MISRARPLCVLTNAISSSTVGRRSGCALEQLGGAENRLQRVVQLVGDAGHEQADGGEALLPDDLALQRLQHLAHLAFLLDRRSRASRASRRLAAMVTNASCSCVSSRLGRPRVDRRRQVAVGDALRGRASWRCRPPLIRCDATGAPAATIDDNGRERRSTGCAAACGAARANASLLRECRRSAATGRGRSTALP